MKYLLLIVLALQCYVAYPQMQQCAPLPQWLSTAVFYQIYPQSFKDTDGDGIGDIKGMTSKLDYVKSLGVNAIWLNPVFESAFEDAGYDVTDFYKVAPRYGANKDLENFMKASHDKGLKVCLDLVAGHTSNKHNWFLQSSKKERNEFTDRYIWTNSKSVKPNDKWVTGNYERDGNYLKNYFDVQPALNYGYANPNPHNSWEQAVTAPGPQSTISELKNIITYWMDKGADGFRVDMAASLIKNDPDFKETYKLWQGVRAWFSKKYPSGVLIAEWSNPEQAVKAGFMIDFMIHFNVPGYPSLFFNKWANRDRERDICYFDLEGKGTPAEFITNYVHQLNAVGTKGYVSIPTANHDFSRPNCGSRNTADQLKVVLAFLMTLKGVPFIYYGDEIGMKFIQNSPQLEGSDGRAGTRTPMQWDKTLKAGFSSAPLNKFYLPLDTFNKRPDVQSQLVDKNSLLNFTKQLIQLRKRNPALGNNAVFKPLYANDYSYPLIYERSSGNEKAIVVINPSGKKATATFDYTGNKSAKPLLAKGVSLKMQKGSITVIAEAVSYGIYKL